VWGLVEETKGWGLVEETKVEETKGWGLVEETKGWGLVEENIKAQVNLIPTS